MTELLTQLEQEGEVRANNNFEAFIACAKKTLPEPLWIYIPKSRSSGEIGGVWTGSVKWFPITLFKDLPGYVEITATFEAKEDGHWEFTRYSYFVSMFSGEAAIDNLADAVLLSRQVSANKGAKILNHPAQEKPQVM